MIILGAGMTGCLAAYAFPNSVIHEYLNTPSAHKAVLRFRSDEISNLTGIPFRKITVHKGIYLNGEFVEPNLQVMNMYSKKVTGGIFDRSISNIDSVERWIAPIDFHQQMLDNLQSRIVYGSNADLDKLKRPILSTIPLPILARKINKSVQIQNGSASPVYVTTAKLKNCDVYQTVYFPGDNTNIYRASITGDELIIESNDEIMALDVSFVCSVFCVDLESITQANHKQEFGKFIPLEKEYREDLMFEITDQYNIYSVGRHATWRKVLLDDVLNDLKRIESMMKTSAYQRMLGKTK